MRHGVNRKTGPVTLIGGEAGVEGSARVRSDRDPYSRISEAKAFMFTPEGSTSPQGSAHPDRAQSPVCNGRLSCEGCARPGFLAGPGPFSRRSRRHAGCSTGSHENNPRPPRCRCLFHDVAQRAARVRAGGCTRRRRPDSAGAGRGRCGSDQAGLRALVRYSHGRQHRAGSARCAVRSLLRLRLDDASGIPLHRQVSGNDFIGTVGLGCSVALCSPGESTAVVLRQCTHRVSSAVARWR